MKTYRFTVEEEDEVILDALKEMFPQAPIAECLDAIASTHASPRQPIRARYQASIRWLVGDLSRHVA
jgi:hypothetical protein